MYVRQGSQLRGINIYRKEKQLIFFLWEACAEEDPGTDRKLRIFAAITASAWNRILRCLYLIKFLFYQLYY